MKQLVYLVMIVAFVGACRKESPKELPENSIVMPSHCNNGVLDGDEIDTDCGGSCLSCLTMPVPCSVDPQTISISGLSADIVYTDDQITEGHQNGKFFIYADGPSVDMKFTFADSIIPPFKAYDNNQYSNITSDEIYVNMFNSQGTWTAYSNETVVNKTATGYSVNLCNAYFQNYNVAGYKIISGNITSH